jgi:hypothetical protein
LNWKANDNNRQNIRQSGMSPGDHCTLTARPEQRWNKADLLACMQAYMLIWAVTVLLLFEDDAAMLACMFC